MNGLDVKPLVAYLVDVETRERMDMQYNPSAISDEKATTYAEIVIPGMSHPRYQFVAGGARRLSFVVSFFQDPDIKTKCDWLRSLQYPEHQGTMLKQAPHRVLFYFGELYPGLECIVRDAKFRHHTLFDPKTLLPKRTDVELTLDEFVRQSVNASRIRKMGDKR